MRHFPKIKGHDITCEGKNVQLKWYGQVGSSMYWVLIEGSIVYLFMGNSISDLIGSIENSSKDFARRVR